MLNKILRDVVTIVVGKQAEPIVEIIHSKRFVNEFNIAKKLDITINQTRNILYKLADHGLVSSERKKDKKKGWYTYFWRIEVLRSLEFLQEVLSKRLREIESQIGSRETKQFYVCNRCNLEFNEENAMLMDFMCPECEDIFELKDNAQDLKELNRARDKILKELEMIHEEIVKETEKVDKARERVRKKEEKEKKEKRAAARKANAAKRAAEKKSFGKTIKKSAKKKVVKKTTKKKIVKKKAAKKKPTKKVAKKKSIKKKVSKKKTMKKSKKKIAKKSSSKKKSKK